MPGNYGTCGHSILNMTVTGLWLMHGDATDRRDMESHIIQRLGSQAPGVKHPGHPRKPRSDPVESHVEILVQRLAQQVTDLTFTVQALNNQVNDLHVQNEALFYARLSEKSESAPQIIPDEIINNQGGGYSNVTGWFTAPVAGEYFFGAVILPERMGQNPQRIYLMLDDEKIILTDGTHSSVTASLHVEVGQRVWLKAPFSGRFGVGTCLNGALVSPAP
nr:hypothetical protein BaRGS_031766 [Batillaria attramentaria]